MTDKTAIESLFHSQKEFFLSGDTKPLKFRMEQLETFQRMLEDYEEQIMVALHKDLAKAEFESFVTELLPLREEIKHAMKHLSDWMKPERVKPTKAVFPSRSFIYKDPYGVCLNISPWNYPLLLSLSPALGAIAAGNTVILKPSEFSPHTSRLLKEMISETFEEHYFSVVTGDAEASQELLQQPFDYIFFTGSTQVGKIIMKAAAEHLTPVTLELGGKSPVIVDESADIEIAAKRIAWAKFVNAGQTCVAPDFMYVHENVQEQLLELMKQQITEMYGEDASRSEDYPRIINERHFDRLKELINPKKIYTGGDSDRESKYISPTILNKVKWDDPIMEEEIFGPILPVMDYQNLEEVLEILERRAKPLAFYIFTSDKRTEKEVLNRMSFGGGAVNDAIIHLGNHNLPFGGVGKSGMGAYHGKHSFDTFSHRKSVIKSRTFFDPPFRYPPYNEKPGWLRRFF